MESRDNTIDIANNLPPQSEIAKLPSDGGEDWNRLIFESSPYLLQHAANPVDWYPWGEEAFAEAKRRDVPVFLSVGYATCHWCHVMEHESFEDAEIGKLLSDHFVCIKVDREERPDIDHVYMTVTQALTGSGGWPMTVILTPEKKPFFAGTYFPKESKYGRPGIRDLVRHIDTLWKDDREKVSEATSEIASHIQKMSGTFPGNRLNEEIYLSALDSFKARFDREKGGFGSRPKFPVPHNLSLLLRIYKKYEKEEALRMVEKTLTEMRKGGIFDQVGFGFHRYSTDEDWLLPHFEKMLYDQALLMIAYTEAYQVTGNELYRQTVEEIADYVLRDMTHPEGGFYSAEDADSEGVEGKFYIWTVDEVTAILGEEKAQTFCKIYNLKEEGNFREESTGELIPANIPHLEETLNEIAKQRGIDPNDLKSDLNQSRILLYKEREKRIHPLKDDKILTDWNGLMIGALSMAGAALNDPRLIDAARNAADFILDKMRAENGDLLKRYRTGNAGLPAHLNDYSFFTFGLVELYQSTLASKYLEEATKLSDKLLQNFWDSEKDAFFQTSNSGEELIVRAKEAYDGATPSGNSVSALVFAKLGKLTGDESYTETAQKTIDAFSGVIDSSPSNFSFMLIAQDFLIGPGQEIILTGKDIVPTLMKARKKFIPDTVFAGFSEQKSREQLVRLAPFLKDYQINEKDFKAYVCQNFSCRQPTTDKEDFLSQLE